MYENPGGEPLFLLFFFSFPFCFKSRGVILPRFQQCTLNSQNQFVFEINRLSVPSTMLASVNDILSHFQEHHTLPTPRVEISLLCTILLRVSYRSPLAIAAPFANPRDYFVDNPGHHSGDSAAMTLTQASRDQYMERLLESEVSFFSPFLGGFFLSFFLYFFCCFVFLCSQFDRETIRHVQELRRRFSIGVRVRTAASPHGAVDDFEDLAFRIYHVLVRLLGGDVDEVKDPEELALFRRLEELRDGMHCLHRVCVYVCVGPDF